MRKVNWLTGGVSGFVIFSQAAFLGAEPVPKHLTTPISQVEWAQDTGKCPAEWQQIPGDRLPPECQQFEPDGMAQIRSVVDLDDIRPTDWAYQALQALIERYDVLTGYPDASFRGDRPLSRYEFAAVLNQVFTKLEELFATGEIARIREDFSTLRRLQQSYGTIGDDLETRLNNLDAQLSRREQRQFSTTTKLSGQAVAVYTNGTGAQFTNLARIRLDLRTSFSGNDLLLTQLETGNDGGDAISRAQGRNLNFLGTVGEIADGGGLDYVGVDGLVRISKLYYSFPVIPNLSLTVGSRLNPRDFIDNNRFANSSDTNFSSSFFMNNPLIVQNLVDRPGGAGAVLTWKPSKSVTLRALYAAADAASAEKGLFHDRYQGSIELGYALNPDLVTRLQFTHAEINGLEIYAGGINVEWAWNQRFAFFGRYGIGNYRGFSPLLGQDLDLNPQTWAVGAIIRNIVIPDSTAGLAIGQPFVSEGLGTATQTNVEGFYSFLINENISFTPGLLIVANPDNRRASTIWEFYVRMVFSF